MADDLKKRVYNEDAPKPQQPTKKPVQRYDGTDNMKSGSLSLEEYWKNLTNSIRPIPKKGKK